MHPILNRWLFSASLSVFCLATAFAANAEEPMRIATFRCNATPPLGQPLISNDRLGMVESPLLAKGIVLEAAGRRYVICALDWCELNNGGHDAYVQRLAEAAGTEPSLVAIQTVHQHTAPLVDSDSQKMLADLGYGDLQIDPIVFNAIGQRMADAVKEAVAKLEPFDQIGIGQAKVERVAATRRPVDASGKIVIRWSKCDEPAVKALPEGPIDPYLKTITFARAGKPLARLHYYATHPQTFYGDGRASSDFVGDVREALEKREGVFQIYFNGCGGDVTMGKYNDGSKKDREELTQRLTAGMEASIAETKLSPVHELHWRSYSLSLPRRTDSGFTVEAALACLKNPKSGDTARVCFGAERLVFHERAQKPIVLNSLEIGNIHMVHLPGEPMIDFQRYAQSLKPSDFVAVAGYGDCGTGYICPAKAFNEGGYEPTASNVSPEGEPLLKKAIAALLGAE
jgi:hypothetical protein